MAKFDPDMPARKKRKYPTAEEKVKNAEKRVAFLRDQLAKKQKAYSDLADQVKRLEASVLEAEGKYQRLVEKQNTPRLPRRRSDPEAAKFYELQVALKTSGMTIDELIQKISNTPANDL